MAAMERFVTVTLALVACVAVCPRDARAQAPSWEGRVLIGVGGGLQATSTDFPDRFTIERYAERGSLEASYEVERAANADGLVAVRVWRQLGVGVAVSWFSDPIAAPVSARVPHPFFFARHREIEGVEDGLRRTETGVHFQALYMLPVASRLRFVLSGGPSLLMVEQRLIADVLYSEEYPYDTASFVRGTTQTVKEKAFGFNAGVEAIVPLARHLGLSGGVRFSRAAVTLPSVDDPIDIDAGGLHVAAGLRLLF